MLPVLVILLGLFIMATVSLLAYSLFARKALRSMNSSVKNLLDALTALKAGNLAKRIERVPRISRTPFHHDLNRLSQGIIHATNEFNNITIKPLQRLCYIGADSYLEGRICGKEMARLIDNKGEVAIVQIKYDLTATVLRQKGFENICKAQYPGIKIVEVTYGDPERTSQCVRTWIKKFPKLKGIYVVEGLTPPAAAEAVVASKREIKIVGHDIEVEIAEHLKNRNIHVSISQNPNRRRLRSWSTPSV